MLIGGSGEKEGVDTIGNGNWEGIIVRAIS